mgnify:FL=1
MAPLKATRWCKADPIERWTCGCDLLRRLDDGPLLAPPPAGSTVPFDVQSAFAVRAAVYLRGIVDTLDVTLRKRRPFADTRREGYGSVATVFPLTWLERAVDGRTSVQLLLNRSLADAFSQHDTVSGKTTLPLHVCRRLTVSTRRDVDLLFRSMLGFAAVASQVFLRGNAVRLTSDDRDVVSLLTTTFGDLLTAHEVATVGLGATQQDHDSHDGSKSPRTRSHRRSLEWGSTEHQVQVACPSDVVSAWVLLRTNEWSDGHAKAVGAMLREAAPRFVILADDARAVSIRAAHERFEAEAARAQEAEARAAPEADDAPTASCTFVTAPASQLLAGWPEMCASAPNVTIVGPVEADVRLRKQLADRDEVVRNVGINVDALSAVQWYPSASFGGPVHLSDAAHLPMSSLIGNSKLYASVRQSRVIRPFSCLRRGSTLYFPGLRNQIGVGVPVATKRSTVPLAHERLIHLHTKVHYTTTIPWLSATFLGV